MALVEPDGFECHSHLFQVRSPHEQVDILRISRGRRIDARHPRCDGMASNHTVWDARLFQGCCRTQQTLSHEFHGFHHPIDRGESVKWRHGESQSKIHTHVRHRATHYQSKPKSSSERSEISVS